MEAQLSHSHPFADEVRRGDVASEAGGTDRRRSLRRRRCDARSPGLGLILIAAVDIVSVVTIHHFFY